MSFRRKPRAELRSVDNPGSGGMVQEIQREPGLQRLRFGEVKGVIFVEIICLRDVFGN